MGTQEQKEQRERQKQHRDGRTQLTRTTIPSNDVLVYMVEQPEPQVQRKKEFSVN